jgi:hypothetical protein
MLGMCHFRTRRATAIIHDGRGASLVFFNARHDAVRLSKFVLLIDNINPNSVAFTQSLTAALARED